MTVHSLSDVASRVDAVLSEGSSDLMPLSQELQLRDRRLRYDVVPSQRRDVDPLTMNAPQCFCDWSTWGEEPSMRISENSLVGCLSRRSKAHLFSSSCGPEPGEEHFADMLELASRLGSANLCTMNLPGSGASGPQHFHTQIVRECKTLSSLLDNIRPVAGSSVQVTDKLRVTEVMGVIWGVRLEFAGSVSARDVGLYSYRLIHHGLRYGSQLHLSYNPYVRWKKTSHQVDVLLRPVRVESPFSLPDVVSGLQRLLGYDAGLAVASGNAFWRFGWLEAIGGLPARKDFSPSSELLDLLYTRMSLDENQRRNVFDYLVALAERVVT